MFSSYPVIKDNRDLTKYLVSNKTLQTPALIEAFQHVDRRDFVAPDYVDQAYLDRPLPIGHAQTISQPTTVAMMLELLQPQAGQEILDIGSGSGWTTALLGHVVGKDGSVLGLELLPKLVGFGQSNLAKYDFTNASIKQAQPGVLGVPGRQFDRVLVSAAADRLPDGLVEQVKRGGRMVLPIRNSLWLVEKDLQGKVSEQEIPGFVFVPLIH